MGCRIGGDETISACTPTWGSIRPLARRRTTTTLTKTPCGRRTWSSSSSSSPLSKRIKHNDLLLCNSSKPHWWRRRATDQTTLAGRPFAGGGSGRCLGGTSSWNVRDNLYVPPPTETTRREDGIPLLVRASHFEHCTFLYDTYSSPDQCWIPDKISYTHGELLTLSSRISVLVQSQLKEDDSLHHHCPRIALYGPPGPAFVACLWAIWSSGCTAVPLALSHTRSELHHVLQDATPRIVLTTTTPTPTSAGEIQETELHHALQMWRQEQGPPHQKNNKMDCYHVSEMLPNPQEVLANHNKDTWELGASLSSQCSIHDASHIMYTSGTTGRPKGVLTSHYNLFFQVTDLCSAWGWNQDDAILHVLPLHHVHGFVNQLCCAAWVGASVEFAAFTPRAIWKRWGTRFLNRKPLTLFMGVPTVYAKLLEHLQQDEELLQQALDHTLHSSMRLCVCGSAALPTSIMHQWQSLTGHLILERYGMTEFAMALSNPLHPVERRLPGHVGLPLPSVQVKIVEPYTNQILYQSSVPRNQMPVADMDDNDDECKDAQGGSPPKNKNEAAAAAPSTDHSPLRSGELRVRGPTVFGGYWNRPPEVTATCMDEEGYFCTGDVAAYNPQLHSIAIWGRQSVDILKVAGYKLSALELERVLLEHEAIAEVVILGIPDETYGERVAAIVRLVDNESALTLEALQQWCSEGRLAHYKMPSRLRVVKEIPKNAMGKVNKKELQQLFQEKKE